MGRLISLLEIPLPRHKRFNQDFLARPRRFYRLMSNSFGFCLGMSILAHLFFFGLLFGIATSRKNFSTSSMWQKDDKILRLAADIFQKPNKKSPLGEKISSEKAASLLQKIYDRLVLSPELTNEERSEILRKILEISFSKKTDLFVEGIDLDLDIDKLVNRFARSGWKLSSGTWVEALPATSGRKIEIHKIKKEELDLLSRMVKRQSPEKTKYFSNGGMISVATKDGPEEVPSEYYYRSSPYRQIIGMGGYLFSIIRERIMPEKSEYRKSASRPANLPETHLTLQAGSSFQLVFISEPSSAVVNRNLMKQRLSESEIKKILDDLMLLDINEQIYVFKKEYLDNYNWGSDELARLTRSFLFNNLNGVFFVLDSLSATFDAIEELYYKRPIYDFLAELTGLFPGTRTNAEIRFYLASALDFEQRTLKRLLESAGEIDDVISGRKKPASIFQPEVKAFVVKQVYQDFCRLSQKWHISIDEIWDWYLKRQEQFYAGLTEYGGETKNRALYNWGRLLWTTGRYEQAIKKWNCVDPCFPIPSRVFWWIKDLLGRYGLNKYTKKAIDEELMSENNSCREELLERHLKFHTWQKRSEKNSGN